MAKASRNRPAANKRAATKAVKPVRKAPAKQPAALVAKVAYQVNSRAEVDALPAAERKRFAVGAAGIVGGKTLDQTCAQLGALMMGVLKLELRRSGKHVYDVWINTVLDDGTVLVAGTSKRTHIGISQTRVYDQKNARDAECDAIYRAIYKGRVKYPPFVETLAWT